MVSISFTLRQKNKSHLNKRNVAIPKNVFVYPLIFTAGWNSYRQFLQAETEGKENFLTLREAEQEIYNRYDEITLLAEK